MRRLVCYRIFFVSVVLLFCCGALDALAAKEVQIDVLYMNHGPMQPTIQKMRELFSRYGGKLNVSWHDFESDEGAAFMEKKGIHRHVPLLIWLDGKDTVALDGVEVKFVGFPTGAGPLFFQGNWTMDDMQKAIEQVIPKE